MIERSHRQLKDALMGRNAGNSWPSHLPWVLLGIRAFSKKIANILPVELVYGAPLLLLRETLCEEDATPEALRKEPAISRYLFQHPAKSIASCRKLNMFMQKSVAVPHYCLSPLPGGPFSDPQKSHPNSLPAL